MQTWNYIDEVNRYFVNLTQINADKISFALVATLLVIFGDKINILVNITFFERFQNKFCFKGLH